MVSFSVDTTPDAIQANQVTVIAEKENTTTVQINSPKLSLVEAKFGGSTVQFSPIAETIWQSEIPIQYLNTETFTLSNRDLAGNIWEGELETKTILDQLNTVPQFNNVPSTSAADTQGLFISKAGVNMGFIVFLGMMFGMDWAILGRTGLTHRSGKSHLHFAVFVIIAIIAIAGTIVGRVGTGTSNF